MDRIHLTLSTHPRPQIPGSVEPPSRFWRLKAVLTLFLFVSLLIGLLIAALVLGSIIAALLLIVVTIGAVVFLVKRAVHERR